LNFEKIKNNEPLTMAVEAAPACHCSVQMFTSSLRMFCKKPTKLMYVNESD